MHTKYDLLRSFSLLFLMPSNSLLWLFHILLSYLYCHINSVEFLNTKYDLPHRVSFLSPVPINRLLRLFNILLNYLKCCIKSEGILNI
jgi:hypothetical protein